MTGSGEWLEGVNWKGQPEFEALEVARSVVRKRSARATGFIAMDMVRRMNWNGPLGLLLLI